jgi:hypothetical protein
MSLSYKTSTVPVYFIWLKYISWLGYGNEILVVNQWRDIVDIPCPDNGLNSTRCYTNGKQVIAAFSMNEVIYIYIGMNYMYNGFMTPNSITKIGNIIYIP